ncbi:unnamed protein product [Arctia plantaginis]|uniref:Uncharacterized protein n=1 Tax=Arctia plantaginis TaxID=874455 RepID=A0A8S0ZRH6_ARCPL|nr:unnamed protein product [Arctia plantaginis]
MGSRIIIAFITPYGSCILRLIVSLRGWSKFSQRFRRQILHSVSTRIRSSCIHISSPYNSLVNPKISKYTAAVNYACAK